MDHADHVGLIRAGVEGAGPRWLELGAGEGAFTLALADLLGPAGRIVAQDRDGGALRRLAAEVSRRFPATDLTTIAGDFRTVLPEGPFDGVLAANSLHFVVDPAAVIARTRTSIRPGGRVVVVEYDADRGNPWVPHPFSFSTWRARAPEAGLADTRLIGRVPSRFLGAIYAAVSDVSRDVGARLPADGARLPAADTVLHSRPHGDDREE